MVERPIWLPHPDKWRTLITTSPAAETQAEAKAINSNATDCKLSGNQLAASCKAEGELDKVKGKFNVWRAIRITAQMFRFNINSISRLFALSTLKRPLL